MWKAVISSESLYQALDLHEDNTIAEARFIDNMLKIQDAPNGNGRSITCKFEGATAWLPQYVVNWVKIKAFLATIPDQPIILTLGENMCSITLMF